MSARKRQGLSEASPRDVLEGSSSPSLVVVIGSSAGGLDALTQLLSRVPLGLDASYVVAQHLAPEPHSSLPELLSRATKHDVVQASDGLALQVGQVIVAPPGVDIRVTDGLVVLTHEGEGPGPSPNIDILMSSVAHASTNVVGVILSGTGADGSQGIRDLHAVGGVVLVQDPSTAKYAAMPQAAIETGLVDLVLSPHDMGAVIERLSHEFPVDGQSLTNPTGTVSSAAPADEDSSRPSRGETRPEIDEILDVLTASTGINFSEYKDSTVARQCARRQLLTGAQDIAAYRDLVLSDPQETMQLVKALEVGVTAFFRDPDVWQALTEHLKESKRPDHDTRVWVAGCATGEEAYTVAMILASVLSKGEKGALPFKIFATDVSESSLEVARRGTYSDDAVAAIPEELRERWMRQLGHAWVVDPAIRDSIVFARHDMASDPPFPQIDLITLRNTLIYFKPRLQQRVMEMCHFALEPGGILVLGTTERAGDHRELFSPLDQDHRIFTRLPGPAHQRWVVRKNPKSAGAGVDAESSPVIDMRQQLLGALVAGLLPPGLVVDSHGEVLEVLGEVSTWCRLGPGELSRGVVSLVREELRQPVKQMLIQAKHAGPEGVSRDVALSNGWVRVSIRSLEPLVSGLQVITFTTQPIEMQSAPDDEGATAVSRVEFDRVTDELRITEKALQATIEELESSNEELRSLNEELQASAEEMQASTEEVQASNEELEASNEQLSSLNHDLEERSQALIRAKSELENIQSSLTSGLVIVDENLAITKYTPLSVRLFPLIEADIGRKLTDIPTTITVPDLERSLRECVANGEVRTLEISGVAQDFLVQVAPYVVADGNVIGALLTISDVTDLLSARRRVARALAEFELVTDSLRETVWQRDSTGSLLFLNSAVERLFGLNRSHVLADPQLLIDAIHPDDRPRVIAAASAPAGRWDVLYRIVRPDGVIRWVEESAITTSATGHHDSYTVGSVLDVTERIEAQTKADGLLSASRRQNEVLEALLGTTYLGLVLLDEEGHILVVNDCFAELVGLPLRSLKGTALASLIPNFDGPEDLDAAEGMWSEPGVVHRVLRTHEGKSLWVAVASQPVTHVDAAESDSSRVAWVVSVHDLTKIRDHTGELVMQARFDQLTGALTRAHFRDRLNEELVREMRTHRGVAVLWIDLDGFKDVNDRHGHRAGDAVLREVASRLQGAARRQDFVGRLGGDEFAMIVTEFNNLDSLEAVATRVLAVLRNPIPGPDGLLYISASIGIAVGPADGQDADALMHSADVAMYVAKEAGRDTHAYFQGEMNEEAERHASQRHELTEAIRARDFELAYQPAFDLKTGRMVMAETLVRWRRNGELVPAAQFIDAVRDSGQLRPLGQIVLSLIDNDLRYLDSKLDGRVLPVGLNISPEELEARDLVRRVMEWDPPGGFGRIVVEVTEATLMAHQGHAMEALRLLRRLGATIAIDDFGTGFSNLSMLQRLMPTIVKIDRSLLVSAEGNEQATAILEAAIHVGHALGAEVVMEGIETQSQADLALALHADLGQGFVFAKPMPIAELVEWEKSHTITLDGKLPIEPDVIPRA